MERINNGGTDKRGSGGLPRPYRKTFLLEVFMKRLLVFLIFSLLAEFCMADDELYGLGILTFSSTLETTKVDEQLAVGFQGLGLDVPLIFNKKEIGKELYSFAMIKPAAAVEYNFRITLLRIRTGVHFGIFEDGLLGFSNYYAGLSGLYIGISKMTQ